MIEEVEEQPIVEYELDLDNLPPTKHNWVVRGDIISCEGAGHPCHQHYIKRVSTKPTE